MAFASGGQKTIRGREWAQGGATVCRWVVSVAGNGWARGPLAAAAAAVGGVGAEGPPEEEEEGVEGEGEGEDDEGEWLHRRKAHAARLRGGGEERMRTGGWMGGGILNQRRPRCSRAAPGTAEGTPRAHSPEHGARSTWGRGGTTSGQESVRPVAESGEFACDDRGSMGPMAVRKPGAGAGSPRVTLPHAVASRPPDRHDIAPRAPPPLDMRHL